MSRFWRHFISNGLSRRIERRLGLFGHPAAVRAALQHRLALESERGFVVRLVQPGSPAHQAGVIEDDVIVSLGEWPIRDTAGLHKLLGRLPADLPLPIILVRGERRLERWVMLDDLPDRQPTEAG
jgi:S1-C subfamily serine protease